MRYIVVQQSDNLIINAIEWDGTAEWSPPDGCFVVQNDTIDIGQTYTP